MSKITFFLHSLLALATTTVAAAAQTATVKPGASFEWVLSEQTTDIPSADIIDVDLFEASAERVAQLNASGKKVVCYINVGAWEDWRPDKADFPATSLGKDYDGWPGEKWLNIADKSGFEAIIKARMDLCKAKGFWGIEPDNMDLHEQQTGFKIARQDQVDYSKWLAEQAHQRGLTIGLKNAPDLLPDLAAVYDWALLEDCFEYKFCAEFSPMVAAGKPVFAVEYTDSKIDLDAFCKEAKALNFFPLIKERELGAWSKQCP